MPGAEGRTPPIRMWISSTGWPDVPVAGLPQILHLVEDIHIPIGGVLPSAPDIGVHGRHVREGVGPCPDVAGGVRSPHTVKDILGRLGRFLPVAAGQAHN